MPNKIPQILTQSATWLLYSYQSHQFVAFCLVQNNLHRDVTEYFQTNAELYIDRGAITLYDIITHKSDHNNICLMQGKCTIHIALDARKYVPDE